MTNIETLPEIDHPEVYPRPDTYPQPEQPSVRPLVSPERETSPSIDPFIKPKKIPAIEPAKD